jgi:superfamily II helicase
VAPEQGPDYAETHCLEEEKVSLFTKVKERAQKDRVRSKTMGQNVSKKRDLYVQMLMAMLKTRGNKVRLLQFIAMLAIITLQVSDVMTQTQQH